MTESPSLVSPKSSLMKMTKNEMLTSSKAFKKSNLDLLKTSKSNDSLHLIKNSSDDGIIESHYIGIVTKSNVLPLTKPHPPRPSTSIGNVRKKVKAFFIF